LKAFVKDANLLIDLLEGRIDGNWFSLGYEVFTSSLVLLEITEPGQRATVDALLAQGTLRVADVAADGWQDVAALANQWGVSVPDASAAKLAMDLGATLLTGDGRLRAKAREARLDVKGTLWVFDHLVELERLSFPEAAAALRRVLAAGSFLPRDECEARLALWDAAG
jgi:predicted nucleic acid-binding protein